MGRLNANIVQLGSVYDVLQSAQLLLCQLTESGQATLADKSVQCREP